MLDQVLVSPLFWPWRTEPMAAGPATSHSMAIAKYRSARFGLGSMLMGATSSCFLLHSLAPPKKPTIGAGHVCAPGGNSETDPGDFPGLQEWGERGLTADIPKG